MDVLVLGGTAWLGREISEQALARGHDVTCLARGESGAVAHGARLVRADRSADGAYAEVAGRDWDEVVEVSWQPGLVRGALDALGERAAHWTYVSSVSAYADNATPGADESAALVATTELDEVGPELYSEAKATCERDSLAAVGERLLIARAGLIGGPGDHTGRSGGWVARAAAAPDRPLLVPARRDLPLQVIDARDLAAWLLDAAASGVVGTFNAVGPVTSLEEWIALARRVGGHAGEVVEAPREWLLEHGVRAWAGPDSLTAWLDEPDHESFLARPNDAAVAAGLRCRPYADLVTDLLAWEVGQGLERDRPAGLPLAREAELVRELTGS